jgi:hypothetical protein
MPSRLPLHFLAATFAVCALPALSQETASVNGTVSDTSGAVVPNVVITLVNPKTNTRYTAKTNNEGVYRLNNVAPGPGYVETFTAAGFTTVTVSDVYANVGSARTQNAQLQPGVNTEVQVSATTSRVTINTVDASIGNTLDINAVYDLPVQSRNTITSLFSLQPGVTTTSAGTVSVTGARTDQNSVTIDGLDVNDIAAGSSLGTVGGAPADAIQEFKGTVAGLLPISGTGGGGQFQLVTKSGTNSFHGNINDYHRDVSTVANDWFNNNAGVARPNLIRNQFGGNIGGPVWRNRLFFFFNYYGQRITQSTNLNRTVPIDSFRNGNVAYILARDAAGNACAATSRQNTTPQCIGFLNSSQIAALDPQHLGFNPNVAALLNSRYPHANDLTLGDGINSAGLRFTTPTPNSLNNYWGRVDYNLSSKHRIFIRGGWNKQNSTQTAIQFPGDPTTHPFVDGSYSYVIGHTWTIGSNKINQFEFGDNVEIYNFSTTYNPTGVNQLSTGSLLTSPYSSASSQRRRVPIPVIRDDFNWTVGNHNFGFGGTFKFIKTNSQLVNDFSTYTLGLGGNTATLNSALRPTNLRAGTTASTTYDRAFALALGHVAAIGSNYNYNNQGTQLAQGTGAVRRYRYFQTELYFGDQWRVSPKLTLDYGVRYQLYSVPYEAQGNEAVQNTSFNDYFGARLAQSKAGISGNAAVPFITYNLGGKANSGPDLYSPNYKDLAPRFGFAYSPDTFTVFHGSASVVFDRTVINAVNFIQDQSSYFFQNSATRNYGTAGSATTSLLNDPRLGANTSLPAPPSAPAISKPYTPFVTNGVPNGLAGNQFNTIVDPNLKDPYNLVFTGGMQHDIRGGFVLTVDYVARLGRRLLANADASQLIDFADSRSGQGLGAAFASISTQVRNGGTAASVTKQAWFENVLPAGYGASHGGYASNTAYLVDNYTSLISVGDFADFVQSLSSSGVIPANVGMASQFAENTFETNKGSSNYHGLLLTLTKNTSHGIRFDFNYTWSHSIDNTSSVANFIPASSGFGFVCDAQNLRTCRASSDFDVRHVMNANFIYNLPFGRGKSFGGNIPWLLDEAIGGWQISGIPQWRSGLPFTAQTGAYVAGYANNAPTIFNGNFGAIAPKAKKNASGQVNLFSDPALAAASFQGPIGFQIGNRNILRGPSAWQFDAGLAKTFRIIPEDKLNLKFRADAFNLLNHPVFSNPATVDITSGSFGQITSVAVAPRVAQFALRLEF